MQRVIPQSAVFYLARTHAHTRCVQEIYIYNNVHMSTTLDAQLNRNRRKCRGNLPCAKVTIKMQRVVVVSLELQGYLLLLPTV